MRVVMLVYADVDRAREWAGLTREDQSAAEVAVQQWYEPLAISGEIADGAELAWPRHPVVVHGGDPSSVDALDESDRDAVLSGVMVLEVADDARAHEIASTWPDLVAPGDRVELYPVRAYDEA